MPRGQYERKPRVADNPYDLDPERREAVKALDLSEATARQEIPSEALHLVLNIAASILQPEYRTLNNVWSNGEKEYIASLCDNNESIQLVVQPPFMAISAVRDQIEAENQGALVWHNQKRNAKTNRGKYQQAIVAFESRIAHYEALMPEDEDEQDKNDKKNLSRAQAQHEAYLRERQKCDDAIAQADVKIEESEARLRALRARIESMSFPSYRYVIPTGYPVVFGELGEPEVI